jgi:hypothetical protein
MHDLAGLFGVRCLQLGLFQLEVPERKSGTQSEATVRGGETRSGCECEEGGSGSAGFGPETMPDCVGDPLQLTIGSQVKIEEDEREIAIAEKEISALNGLRRFLATNPEEATAFLRAVRRGIKGVAAIDEGEREIA